MEVYGYRWNAFGAKSLSTCANYCLHQVAKYNSKAMFLQFAAPSHLRSSSQKADIEQARCENWQNLLLYRFIKVLQWLQSAHIKQQVFVANRAKKNTGKLLSGSTETRQKCRKLCRHRNWDNWKKPETSSNGICHIFLSSTLICPKNVQRSSKLPRFNPQRLSGPDLLQSLVGIIFCFREHAFSWHTSNVSSCWCPKRWHPMLKISLATRSRAKDGCVRVYTNAFGAKSLPTCANYSLHQVAKFNSKGENLVLSIHPNLNMFNFLSSVRTPQKAAEA